MPSDAVNETSGDDALPLLLKVRLDDDRRRVGHRMARSLAAKPGSARSAPEDQIRFLRTVVENDDESSAFMADPTQYATDRGVQLDPEIIRLVTNAVAFDANLNDEILARVGEQGLRDLEDLRAGHQVDGGLIVVAAANCVKLAVCSDLGLAAAWRSQDPPGATSLDR